MKKKPWEAFELSAFTAICHLKYDENEKRRIVHHKKKLHSHKWQGFLPTAENVANYQFACARMRAEMATDKKICPSVPTVRTKLIHILPEHLDQFEQISHWWFVRTVRAVDRINHTSFWINLENDVNFHLPLYFYDFIQIQRNFNIDIVMPHFGQLRLRTVRTNPSMWNFSEHI